jgi:hypothetical protein
MKETFVVVFKNGDRLQVTYPRDSANLFKLQKISQATIGNVIAIEGSGHIAQTLRKRYGLSEEKELSELEIIQETTGLSKENILKKKDKILSKLQKLRKKHILCLVLFIIICFGFLAPSIQVAHADAGITIASSSGGLGYWYSDERHIVWVAAPIFKWYAVWLNNSDYDVYYSIAGPDASWSSPVKLTNYANNLGQLCIASNGTQLAIYFQENTVNDFWFKKAKINSDGSLTWVAEVRVIDGGAYIGQAINIFWSKANSQWWVSSQYYGGSDYVFTVSHSSLGASWASENFKVGTSPFHARYVNCQFASLGTTTYFFYNDYYATTTMYFRTWTTSLQGEQTHTLTAGMSGSTVKNDYWGLNYDTSKIWFIWRASDNKVYMKSFDGASTWSSETKLDDTATDQNPIVGSDSVTGNKQFFWIRSNTMYSKILYSNGTLGSVYTPFTMTAMGAFNTMDYGPFMACSWRDTVGGVDYLKIGLIRAPSGPVYVTFYLSSHGQFYVNSANTANGTLTSYSNGTVLSLMGLVNSGYIWNNFTRLPSTGYTTQPYSYTITGNATLWCHFAEAVLDYSGYMPVDQARAIMFGSVILIAVLMVPALILLLRRR